MAKQYKVIFKGVKDSWIQNTLIYQDKKLFNYADAVRIAQDENKKHGDVYAHWVEEA